MTCEEMAEAIARLELCTGSEIHAMFEHWHQCAECRNRIENKAHEELANCSEERDLAIAAYVVDIARKYQKAALDPEIAK